MKKFVFLFLTLLIVSADSLWSQSNQIRLLVVTGGHDYNVEHFRKMLENLGDDIRYQIIELPAAFDMFQKDNRNKYDVVVFYHMWQDISEDQAHNLSECIHDGKPLVVLHHSICAFDNWDEYVNITGGKYFHKPTLLNGIEYPACTYIHDLHFRVKILDHNHPVTRGLSDFEIFDETYKGFYVSKDVTPLLGTDEPTSGSIIGWTNIYGKGRIVTLQSGHDVPTYENPSYRKLLKQAIKWVFEGFNADSTTTRTSF